MPGAMKIWKDSQARRANVPLKTEAVSAVVDSTVPETRDKRGKESFVTKPSAETAPRPKKTRKAETAVYTASPAVARSEVTPEQTGRAEKLEERMQGDREGLYRAWAENGTRLV